MTRLRGYLTFVVLVLAVLVGGLILTAYLGALGLVVWTIAFALVASWLTQWVKKHRRHLKGS